MFFDGWTGLLRVLVVGTLAYAALVLLLRVTGKRTLSKMNAFDRHWCTNMGRRLRRGQGREYRAGPLVWMIDALQGQ